jgi:pimeloyl-ACP methyl ester carboxylesterase
MLIVRAVQIRYDLRGHGRSGKPEVPEAHTGKRYAEDFAAVCMAFGLVKPVFAGWSWGGESIFHYPSHPHTPPAVHVVRSQT